MKVITRSPRGSIFMKIVLTFLVLLIPLYTLNLYMNEAGQVKVRREIVGSMNAKVELYVNLIETDIQRVVKLTEAYVNDLDLMKLSTTVEVMSDIERTAAILSLKSKLNLVKSSNSFVHNVTAYIPGLNRSVTSNDDAIVDFDEESFRALAVVTNRYESPCLVWKDRLFISVPYPDPPASGNKDPVFLITVEISKPALRDMLEQFTNNGELAVLSGNRLDWSVETDAGSPEIDAALASKKSKALSGGESDNRLSALGVDYLLIEKSSPKLDTTLSIVLPEEAVFGPLESYRRWMLLLTGASVVIIVFFALSIYRIIQRPMRTLLRSFNKVEQGNLNLVVHYPLKDEFGHLFERFNTMVKRLNVLVHEVYENRYRVRLAELRHLQSQINPHFLYNSFFILHRMANLRDHDNIVRFTKYLGDYFQFITRDGIDELPLEKEVKHARTYTEIQAFRFGSRIRSEFGDLPAGLEGVTVPRLILQPLIENAYHYGLENKMSDGVIRIGFSVEGLELSLTVEDNGDELDDRKLQELRGMLLDSKDRTESTGLINVHRRLRIKYGQGSGLQLNRGAGGGLKAELRIPLRREREDSEHVQIADRG